jgi:hypothetical protein
MYKTVIPDFSPKTRNVGELIQDELRQTKKTYIQDFTVQAHFPKMVTVSKINK